MRDQARTNKHAGFLNRSEKDVILTGDLVRFLRNFSTALRSGRTGNPSMSIALSRLAEALQPHSGRDLQDVLSEFRVLQDSEPMGKSDTSIQLEDRDFPSLTLESVKNILDQNGLTKKYLIELGHARFGIPRARLERQPKPLVLDAVQTAMNNEGALGIIAEEAARQGLRRST